MLSCLVIFFSLWVGNEGSGGKHQIYDHHQRVQWTNSSALMHILVCDRQPCGSIKSLPLNEIQSYITGLAGSSPETPGQEEEMEKMWWRSTAQNNFKKPDKLTFHKNIRLIQERYNCYFWLTSTKIKKICFRNKLQKQIIINCFWISNRHLRPDKTVIA